MNCIFGSLFIVSQLLYLLILFVIVYVSIHFCDYGEYSASIFILFWKLYIVNSRCSQSIFQDWRLLINTMHLFLCLLLPLWHFIMGQINLILLKFVLMFYFILDVVAFSWWVYMCIIKKSVSTFQPQCDAACRLWMWSVNSVECWTAQTFPLRAAAAEE